MLYSCIIKRALKEIEKCTANRFKTAAVVFKGHRILTTGKNHHCIPNKRYKKFILKDMIHAEQDALTEIDLTKLKGCSILVLRVTNTGKFAMARPCNNCLDLIKIAGIKKIYYSTRDGEIIKEKI